MKPNSLPLRAARAAARKAQQGVMLIEALIAILLFSLGVIALIGLQSASIATMSQNKFRTDASYLANQIIGQMWTDQANIANYANASYSGRANWNGTVAATLPQGTGTIAVNGSQVTVTVQWQHPDDPIAHRYYAVANINPVWP